MGRSTRNEQQRNIFLEFALIAFDGEMVMRLTFDQIDRQLALRQQGIGADCLAGNSNRIKHGGKHSDFIGLLGRLLTFYGERTDFFGCSTGPTHGRRHS